ncbi:MAG: hypothetical protein AB1801_02105 [Chloroflexota bacterium]
MTYYESDWVFNLVLKLAVVVFLSILAVGLLAGVNPLTALLRSSSAFAAFVVLGWVASLTWSAPELEKVAVNTGEESAAQSNQESAASQSIDPKTTNN